MSRFVDRYSFLPLPAGLTLAAVDGPLRLPAGVQDRVDRLWLEAQEKFGADFHDGPMWTIDGPPVAEQAATGRLTFRRASYRYHYARMADPSLDDRMRLRFTGVGGVLRLADGRLVLGRRSDRVGMDPGLWQLAPTGGLDGRFDAARGSAALVDQVVAEAWEELGLTPDRLTDRRLLGVSVGAERGVHNFIVRADVDLDLAGLQAAFLDRPDPELTAIRAIDPTAPDWPRDADFTAASRFILEMLCAEPPPLPVTG